jgi:hypothetical protein
MGLLSKKNLRGLTTCVCVMLVCGWWVYALSDRSLFDVLIGAAIVAIFSCIVFVGKRQTEAMDFRRR